MTAKSVGAGFWRLYTGSGNKFKSDLSQNMNLDIQENQVFQQQSQTSITQSALQAITHAVIFYQRRQALASSMLEILRNLSPFH